MASGTQSVSKKKTMIKVANAVPSIRALKEPSEPEEGLSGEEKEPRRRLCAGARRRHGVGKAS